MEEPLELYCIQTFTAFASEENGKKLIEVEPKLSVSVQIEGENGRTRFHPLWTEDGPSKKSFSPGYCDEFYFVDKDVGDCQRISVFVEGKHGWDATTVNVKTAGKSYQGNVHSFLKETTATTDLIPTMDSGGFVLGPIIKLRGFAPPLWLLSVLVVTRNIDELPPLQFHSSLNPTMRKSHIPICLYTHYYWKVWRFDFSVELGEQEQLMSYTVPSEGPFHCYLPPLSEAPRIAFGSCLDLAHPSRIKSPAMKGVMFDYLWRDHQANHYHLLLLGGDQVYADGVFVASSAIRKWHFEKNKKKKWEETEFSHRMKKQVECFYFKLYCLSWVQSELPNVFGSIPNMMIYDDHDVFDGWGSRNPYQHNSEVFQGIFAIAKKMYFVFQQQGDLTSAITPYNSEGPYSLGTLLTGRVAVMLPDLRTERVMRTRHKSDVFSESSWEAMERWVERIARHNLKHVFVVCSVPLVYPHSDLGENLLNQLEHQLVDDSRDHWPSQVHSHEIERFIRLLCDITKKSEDGEDGHFDRDYEVQSEENYQLTDSMYAHRTKVSLLVGDVHLASYGIIESREENILIEQFVSSGIAASPPPSVVQKIFFGLFKKKFKVGRYRMGMARLPNGKKCFGRQNFLTLLPRNNSYLARWVGKPLPLEYEFQVPPQLPAAEIFQFEMFK